MKRYLLLLKTAIHKKKKKHFNFNCSFYQSNQTYPSIFVLYLLLVSLLKCILIYCHKCLMRYLQTNLIEQWKSIHF